MTIKETVVRLALKISLWGKAVFAVLEVIAGALFYFASHNAITGFILRLTKDEITEDPRDLIARFLINSSQQLFVSTQHFIAVYLLLHGVVKLVLIVALLKDKLWAYPVSLGAFGLFAAYQIYQLSLARSPWLAVLTVFDLIIIWLVWREYRFIRRRLDKKMGRYYKTT